MEIGVLGEHHVDIGIGAALAPVPAADHHEAAIRIAFIAQMMAIGAAHRPGRDIAGAQHSAGIVLHQHGLSAQHHQQLILALMPVALGRPGARLQHHMARPEGSQPRRRCQPAPPAPFHFPVERRGIAGRVGLRDGFDIELGHGGALLLVSPAHSPYAMTQP